jgi:hypothetical protein
MAIFLFSGEDFNFLFVFVKRDKFPEGAVVGFFYGIGEEAGRKLLIRPVVGQTFATDALAAAGLVGAVAANEILLAAAFIHVLLRGAFFLASPRDLRIDNHRRKRKRFCRTGRISTYIIIMMGQDAALKPP